MDYLITIIFFYKNKSLPPNSHCCDYLASEKLLIVIPILSPYFQHLKLSLHFDLRSTPVKFSDCILHNSDASVLITPVLRQPTKRKAPGKVPRTSSEVVSVSPGTHFAVMTHTQTSRLVLKYPAGAADEESSVLSSDDLTRLQIDILAPVLTVPYFYRLKHSFPLFQALCLSFTLWCYWLNYRISCLLLAVLKPLDWMNKVNMKQLS